MAVQGGADTCMAGLVAVLDREDTASTTAVPPAPGAPREIEDTACTPSGAACVLSRGMLHCSTMQLQTSC